MPYATSGQVFEAYVGKQFEAICPQWVRRQSKTGCTPFPVLEFGQWWGTDPKERDDLMLVSTREPYEGLGE